jgi:putative hydrolase of the HAD superfamily
MSSPRTAPDWSSIDTVLLDLDGTLLDQAYDNHIWRDLVPQRFAVRMRHGHARRVRGNRALLRGARGTLEWYCIDYWTRTLGRRHRALHREVRSTSPGCRARAISWTRMRAAASGCVLLTNSHPSRLPVKHEETGVLDCSTRPPHSHEFGAPKEQRGFWRAPAAFRLRPGARLFADDNSRMLDARAPPASLGVRRSALDTRARGANTSITERGRRRSTVWGHPTFPQRDG